MAITVADNFSYQGKKPLDGRDGFDTLAQMKAYPETSVYDGCMTYCKEDEKYYTFKASNTVDATTGKWREFSGGGGQTYDDFTGATASTAGAHGLVPAPSAGDEGKVLFGNGLWGALPSVDLSVLSNEAFIFDTNEKPVGMWHNRKLLYAKTFTGLNVTPQFNTWTNIVQAPTNIDEMGFVLFARREQNSLLSTGIGIEFYLNDGYIAAECTQNISLRAINQLTVFYTKTTDSPLPSGVKFAGVDENGNVIYKKTFTGTWNSTTTAETKTFPFSSTLNLRKMDGVYHTQYGDWSINTLNYNVSDNRLDYCAVAYTDPSNNTLVVERKGFYLAPLSGRSFEVDVYYTESTT